MTYLQKLITEGVARGFKGQLDVAMEKAGMDFAAELLADPEYRQTIRELIRQQTAQLVEELNQPTRPIRPAPIPRDIAGPRPQKKKR
jgi:hypothetical protein